LWVLISATPAVGRPTTEPVAALPAKHQAFLKEHCFSCHDAEKQKGKFRVDTLSLSITDNLNAERWQKVLNALNSGEMPPEDQKQPPGEAKADFLDELARVMVAARRGRDKPVHVRRPVRTIPRSRPRSGERGF
jgi:hypothetical protein